MDWIEWQAFPGTWVRAAEPAYMPDGSVQALPVEERWTLVRAREKNTVGVDGRPVRLVRNGVVTAGA